MIDIKMIYMNFDWTENWFNDHKDESVPDIVGIDTFKSGSHIFKCLLNCYLFNLTLQAYGSDFSNYKRFSKNISDIFPEKENQELIEPFIFQSLDSRPKNIRDAFTSCCSKLNNLNDTRGRNFKTILEKFQMSSENDICTFFMNTFKVAITVIRKNSNPQNFEPKSPGSYMRLRIIHEDQQYYMPCTSLHRRSYESNYLDLVGNTCNREPYMIIVIPNLNSGQLALGRSENQGEQMSNKKFIDSRQDFMERLPINQLPLDQVVVEELSTEYSSFVKINEKDNQIRAFSYCYIDYCKRFEDDEHIAKIHKTFIDKRTMCLNFNLQHPVNLKRITFEELVQECKNIVELAVKYKEDFQEFVDLRIEEYLEQGFNTVNLLCKIFGISSIITFEDKKNYLRNYFYANEPDSRPIFHFLATNSSGYTKRLWLLMTRRDDYLDGFDSMTLTLKRRTAFIKNNTRENKKTLESELYELKRNYDEKEGFLIKMNFVQNLVIRNFVTSIKEKKPFYMNELIDVGDIDWLKQKTADFSLIDINCREFKNFEVLSFNYQYYEVICHYCNQNFKDERAFYSRNGCCFHYRCIYKCFVDYYINRFFVNKKTEDYEIPCPKCPSNNILIFNFLKDDEYSVILRNFKVYNEKIAICCLCNSEFPFSDDFNIDSPKNFHCLTCLVIINATNECPKCRLNKYYAEIKEDIKLTCKSCETETIFNNFHYDSFYKMVMCKRCIYKNLQSFFDGNSIQNIQNFAINILGYDPIINCGNCNKYSIQQLGDKVCNYCQSKVCFNCYSQTPHCCLCGQQMIDNRLGKWV